MDKFYYEGDSDIDRQPKVFDETRLHFCGLESPDLSDTSLANFCSKSCRGFVGKHGLTFLRSKITSLNWPGLASNTGLVLLL